MNQANKVSLIIPYYEVDDKKKEVLDACIKSFEGQYDELIIIDEKIPQLAKKINKGLSQATGDFLILSNDDVIAREGSLRDLCIRGQVVVPVVHGGIDKLYHGHMACIPREIYTSLGGYDEDYPLHYWIDSSYWMKLVTNGIPIVKHEGVHIDHPEPGRTLKHLREDMANGREIFIKKWGRAALNIVQ